MKKEKVEQIKIELRVLSKELQELKKEIIETLNSFRDIKNPNNPLM